MQQKLIEIRDRATFIPALATRLKRSDSWIVGAAGFGEREYVLLTMLETDQTFSSPNAWTNGRTMPIAHQAILDHWDVIPNEGIVDVRVILGEEKENAESEGVLYRRAAAVMDL